MITVTLLHPTMEGRKLTLELPRETKFSPLTDMLYERDFIQPQKPGYRYLYQHHLCGMSY